MQKVERALARIRPHLTPLAIGGVFVALAGRIAASHQFSPYDGAFHFGLIKLYAHHLNPFLASQPANANQYGAVARDPSYLYHYLMSFPYRLVSLFTDSGRAHVLTIRWMDISFGLITLYLVYRLAKRFGLPTWGARLVTFALAITPIFYDLAGQINYDNLMLPLIFGTVLLTLQVAERFRTKHVPVQKLSLLIALVLLASLVKYSYLPIAVVIAGYLIVVAWRQFGVRKFFMTMTEAFRYVSLLRQVILISLVVVSGILWMQRYGVNIVQYHTPHPQCNVVLNISECSSYAVWARNYQLHQTIAERPQSLGALVMFTPHWFKIMYDELYAIIHTKPVVSYTAVGAMPLLATIIIIGGLLSLRLATRSIAANWQIWLPLGTVAGAYTLALWGQNIADYHNLHEYIAIQGRYLLPVLPIAYLAVAVGYAALFEKLTSLERGRIRAMVSALFVIGWLGLRSVKRLGHAMLVGVVQSATATGQVFNAVLRQPAG